MLVINEVIIIIQSSTIEFNYVVHFLFILDLVYSIRKMIVVVNWKIFLFSFQKF